MIVKYFHRSVDLINSVNKKITSNELIRKRDRVLLSISGGQDSICLMFLLNHFYAQMDLHLALFWCHHLWQFDSFSLMRQIAKLSFLFQFNGYFAISPNFIPSELLARHWRHNCNYRVCFFYNYYKISLAHSANDKVETIFLNLIRGTGLAGLFPLRWTQSVSKKRVQNEEHISQFSTFLFSPFFWYTASLADFYCPTSFRLLHQHTEDNKPRKDLPKFHLLSGTCAYPLHTEGSKPLTTETVLRTQEVQLPTEGKQESNRKKKRSPCYYFRFIYLKEMDIILLPFYVSLSYSIPITTLGGTDVHLSGGCIPVRILKGACDQNLFHHSEVSKFSILHTLPPVPPSVVQVAMYRYTKDWVCEAEKLCKGVAKQAYKVQLLTDAESKQALSSFSCSYIVGNRKEEDPLILKKTKLIVLKQKSQQKLKFEHKSKKGEKKITAKKWFSYVSYTFLKVCL